MSPASRPVLRAQSAAVPGKAGRGDRIVAIAAGDELVNADAAQFGVGAPLVVGGEHEIEVERGQQREHLAAVAGVHPHEHLVEQDDPWRLRHRLVVRGHRGEQRLMQDDGLLAAVSPGRVGSSSHPSSRTITSNTGEPGRGLRFWAIFRQPHLA
jgi:hypothetical protein